jgi:hypothetical protein
MPIFIDIDPGAHIELAIGNRSRVTSGDLDFVTFIGVSQELSGRIGDA